MSNLQLHTLTHPMVRALGWVVFGPPLLEPANQINLPCTNLFELGLSDPKKAETRLVKLNQEPKKLMDWLADKPTRRVGHFFEHLIHFWIEFETDAEIIVAQEQLFENNRTVGEIDFLLRFNNRIIHIETAIKFYLQTQENPEWHHFVGPNTRDNLARKTLHLAQKQLPLGAHSQLQERWALNSPPESWAILKGFLFYPSNLTPPYSTPSGIARNHPQGLWARSNQRPFHNQPAHLSWAIIPKPNWIGPSQFQAKSDDVFTTQAITSRIDAHFESHDAALMVAGLSQNPDGVFQEALRIMVVHPRWPSPDPL